MLEKILERHNGLFLLFSFVGEHILGEELKDMKRIPELDRRHYCCCGSEGESDSEGKGGELHLDL